MSKTRNPNRVQSQSTILQSLDRMPSQNDDVPVRELPIALSGAITTSELVKNLKVFPSVSHRMA
jgi:hypothetical protein